MCGGNEEERRDKATTKPNEKRDAKTTTTEAVTSPNEFMNMRLSGLRSGRLVYIPVPCPPARWREYATGCHGNNGRKW